MTEQITMDEWQAELEKWSGEDEGLTVGEIAEMSGRSRSWANRMIHKGIAAGRYIKGHAIRIDTRDHKNRVPVYRVVK